MEMKEKYEFVSDRANSDVYCFRLGLSNVYLKYGMFVVVYSFLWDPKVVLLMPQQNEQAASWKKLCIFKFFMFNFGAIFYQRRDMNNI